MSLVARAAARARRRPGRRRASSSRFASTSSRASSRRLRASAEEVTPDGVFDSAPEGMPATPAEPPTPARAAVTAPLACPVSLRALDARVATRALKYEEGRGVEPARFGAAGARAEAGIPHGHRALVPPDGAKGPVARVLLSRHVHVRDAAGGVRVRARLARPRFKREPGPGPDEEMRMAQSALLPHARNKVLLDASCGSAAKFTRRFAKSGEYGVVVALDFSAAMLRANARVREGRVSWATSMGAVFVRADIALDPALEGTVGGVHAGAAIHGWPDRAQAVAEIARVLEPGGAFCGTTFCPRACLIDARTQQTVAGGAARRAGARACRLRGAARVQAVERQGPGGPVRAGCRGLPAGRSRPRVRVLRGTPLSPGPTTPSTRPRRVGIAEREDRKKTAPRPLRPVRLRSTSPQPRCHLQISSPSFSSMSHGDERSGDPRASLAGVARSTDSCPPGLEVSFGAALAPPSPPLLPAVAWHAVHPV